MTAWDSVLYGSDEALHARGELLASVSLPEEPQMFAACVGLLALLDPEADQFAAIGDHPVLATLPASLRDATIVAAQVGASGPRLPYSEAVRGVLGLDASYGRVVDPLLELRETIMIARAIREQCVRVIDEGFTYGETAIGGPVGLLLELRELGVATSPDVVDEWLTGFDRVAADPEYQRDDLLREWARCYRAALELLAIPPEQKLLGNDPTNPRRSRRGR